MSPRQKFVSLLRGGALCAVLMAPALAPAAYDAASWRAADAVLTESATDAAGWQVLDCHGAGCEAIFAAIRKRLPPDMHRDNAGRLAVRAEAWHTEQLSHFGPFRADEPIGGEPATPGTPWLDARYSAVDCDWRAEDGAHRLRIAAGGVAHYTGPDGRERRLTLRRVSACERCRAHYLRLAWTDPSDAERGALYASWSDLEFIRGGEGRMGGFAAWSGQNNTLMECVLRPAQP